MHVECFAETAIVNAIPRYTALKQKHTNLPKKAHALSCIELQYFIISTSKRCENWEKSLTIGIKQIPRFPLLFRIALAYAICKHLALNWTENIATNLFCIIA